MTMQFRILGAAVLAGLAVLWAQGAAATPISAGGTITETVLGTAEIYAAKGNPNSAGNGVSTDPNEVTFTAGAGNVFSFFATGSIGCCGGPDGNFTPDGANNGTNITSPTNFSNISGDSRIPLVGLFTNATDPAKPAALVFDADSVLTSFAPLLNQVFYIGDGRTGRKDAAGATQQFVAPTAATSLWLGVIDGFGFVGNSSFYGDNPGEFTVDVTLAAAAVPAPAPAALVLLALLGLGWQRRARP